MFTHLHVHSEYSLLDGACKIKEMAAAAKAMGQKALAITDHGVMYGVVDFFKACRAEGIKPIIGCEVYTAPHSHLDKRSREMDAEAGHLIILVKNSEGYKNLMKLVSVAHVDGFYYRPRIDMELLRKYRGGLIGMSACLAGDIPRALLRGDKERAKKVLLEFKEIFDDFYIELQDHGLKEQRQIMPLLIELARETDTPLAATNDAHYIHRADAPYQDVLMCIQTGKTVEDTERMRFESDEWYLKSEDEMRALFDFVPEAIENTNVIADMCEFEFEFGKKHLPKFDVPQGFEAEDYLEKLCREGLSARYDDNLRAEHTERLEYELSVISKMGFTDYFLIVWDFIRFAKQSGIFVGPGRGSSAGSIVAYALNITDIDPIEYGLLFERFLNPERVSMPDIDMDFCIERRGEVINYVVHKYGMSHVAQIITFGTMKARGAIRDTGRVLNMPYGDVDTIAKMVPDELGVTIEKALNTPKLKAAYESSSDVRRLIDTARAIEGLPRNAGTHAAGVVIAGEEVSNFVPLQKNDEVIVTQFTKDTVEELGLLKMDFLGLRNLTIIRDCLDIAAREGIEIDLRNISYKAPEVYEMLSRGDTEGVFQLESGGMTSFMKRLQPSCLEDIIAGIALYRPGPMDFIPKYIANKQSPEKVSYKHPLQKEILDMTYGCIVYQEQVMEIVRVLGGFSMGKADEVRRAMSKKKKAEMEHAREEFIVGAKEKGISESVAKSIFDDMDAFAQYAFNKAHAACYAVVTYQTAYLKCFYAAPYMAALLTSVMGDVSKIVIYIEQCTKMGIKILPPSINRSDAGFTVEGNAIRFGLCTVRNVGAAFIHECVKERDKNGDFAGLRDFVSRMIGRELNKRAVEGLIKSGAFDFSGASRSQLIAYYESVIDEESNDKRSNIEGQFSLFGAEEHKADNFPPSAPLDKRVLLEMEKAAAGLYFSGHPLDEYRTVLSRGSFTHCGSILAAADSLDSEIYDGQTVTVAGIVAVRRDKLTKKNTQMSFITLEDFTGAIDVIVFPASLVRFDVSLREDSIVSVTGRVDLREDEPPKLILESVAELEKPQEGKTLYIRIDEGDEKKLDALHAVVLRHKGDCAIVLQTPSGEIQAHSSMRIDVSSEATSAINAVLGKNAAKAK
ncbi:MAG: DNA polymerase III subunit alpha [Clostridia bacterium]|nr:DNA polymerase III subunit alpha [Clostridia bacterium]